MSTGNTGEALRIDRHHVFHELTDASACCVPVTRGFALRSRHEREQAPAGLGFKGSSQHRLVLGGE
ncbi:hypothetical protein GCM10010518_00250 [Kitasatospora cinereorecta]